MKDILFFGGLMILGLVIVLVYMLIHFAMMAGASLGLWSYALPEDKVSRARTTLKMLEENRDKLNKLGLEKFDSARAAFELALQSRGIRAWSNLDKSVQLCLEAIINAPPGLRGEVKHALGYPV